MSDANRTVVPRRAGRLPLAAVMLAALLAGTGWTPAPPMGVQRGFHTATPLLDGRVLIAGGYDTGPWEPSEYWSEAEVYDPAAGAWSVVAPMLAGRSGHAAVLLMDGRVLVAGGHSFVNQSHVMWGSAELFDPATSAFAPAAPMLTIQGAELQAVRLDDGRVLAIRGLQAEIYDPAADAWSMTGAPIVGRLSFTATRLADGRVLITGGYASEPPFDAVYSSAEVYSPATGAFTLVGPMSAARLGHFAALLPDGRVLVAGGQDAQQGLSSAELFDPIANAFQPAPSMFAARRFAAATTLASGDVLVTGGAGGPPMMPVTLSSAERYDPIAGAWKPFGAMEMARAYHTLAPLPDGGALAAGGFIGSQFSDAFAYQETAERSGGAGGDGGSGGNGGAGGNGSNGNEGGAGGEGASSSSGGADTSGSSATSSSSASSSSSVTAGGGAPAEPSGEGCSVADRPLREPPRPWALLSFVAGLAALVRRRGRLHARNAG